MKTSLNQSRYKTPWDKEEKTSPLESFIRDSYHRKYHERHPILAETDEAELLNSYILDKCRFCDSDRIQQYGYTKNGIQRYKCNDCGRTFTVTAGTIFQDHTISVSEWIEFCLNIISYESYSATSRNNRNSNNTTYYWIDKICKLLIHFQDDILLRDTVYLDETFIPVLQSQLKRKADGTLYRGLSRNQMCIGIACDISGHIYCKYEGKGKPSEYKTRKTFIKHIQPCSTLIHDLEKSHRVLVDQLALESITYDSNVIKNLEDADNPLEPINRQCFFLQTFMTSHEGFNRKDLPDLLNLYAFIQNTPGDNLAKVMVLLDKALTTKATLKYRNNTD